MSHEEGYVKLQTENLNLRDQVETLAKTITTCEGKIKDHEKEITNAKKEVRTANSRVATAEDTLAANKKEQDGNKRNIAELLSLRRQVTDAKKKEETLQAEIDDLNEQLDVAMMATPQASVVAPRGGGGGGGFSQADLDKKIEEVRLEVQGKAEEELFAITVELEEQLDSQKEEIAELKNQIQNTSDQSTGSASTELALERALAEKAIALRVKDGAVAEAGAAQAELEKSSGTMKDLKAQVQTLSEQLDDARSNPGSTPGRYRDPSGEESFMDSASFAESPAGKAIKTQLTEKEKLVKYLQDRVAEVEFKNRQLQNEKEGLNNTKSTDYMLLEQRIVELKEENELQLVQHTSEMERLQVDMNIITTERDKAMAAGKRAFLERNQAISDVKSAEQKRAQLERLQQKTAKSTDRGTLQTVMGHTDVTFDRMLATMEAVDDDSEKRDAMYDTIFEKEHEILNLKNDQMSMTTIRKMREEELTEQCNVHWGAKCEEYMSAIEILRMQIKELGKEPMC